MAAAPMATASHLIGSLDTIGGTAAGDSNIISGNYLRGIDIGGSDELVEGNYIGTDITGMIAIGNGVIPGYAAMYVSRPETRSAEQSPGPAT